MEHMNRDNLNNEEENTSPTGDDDIKRVDDRTKQEPGSGPCRGARRTIEKREPENRPLSQCLSDESEAWGELEDKCHELEEKNKKLQKEVEALKNACSQCPDPKLAQDFMREKTMHHLHNPQHPMGTCATCGGEMIYNVPRLKENGGFVHKSNGWGQCGANT